MNWWKIQHGELSKKFKRFGVVSACRKFQLLDRKIAELVSSTGLINTDCPSPYSPDPKNSDIPTLIISVPLAVSLILPWRCDAQILDEIIASVTIAMVNIEFVPRVSNYEAVHHRAFDCFAQAQNLLNVVVASIVVAVQPPAPPDEGVVVEVVDDRVVGSAEWKSPTSDAVDNVGPWVVRRFSLGDVARPTSSAVNGATRSAFANSMWSWFRLALLPGHLLKQVAHYSPLERGGAALTSIIQRRCHAGN
jgi:hypothetical protein